MNWRARIGGTFQVLRDGEDLGPPPTLMCGVLVVGLLASGDWCRREFVARQLYPGSESSEARVALRQTLRRTRQWLGEDAFEVSGDNLRLRSFEMDLSLGDGSVASAGLIAPGYDHPWIEEIRGRLGSAPVAVDPWQDRFCSLVLSVAAEDRTAARQLLFASDALLLDVGFPAMEALLRATRPLSGIEPLALRHAEAWAFHLHHSGALAASCVASQKVCGLARRVGRRPDWIRTLSTHLLHLSEIGDEVGAATCRAELDKMAICPSYELLMANARAMHQWHFEDPDSALETLVPMRAELRRFDLTQQIHYLHNFAFLCRRVGRHELAEDLTAEFIEKSQPGQRAGLNARAKAEADLASGNPGVAVEWTRLTRAQARESGHRLGVFYVEEFGAEALLATGRIREAKQMWSGVLRARQDAGGRLTRRLRSQHRRFALV